MCTVIILRRPGHAWPLLLAANRDELRSRPSQPPGRHWPDRPEVVAGLDKQAKGSWLGINDHGMVAAVLNRTGTLGPEPGRRSRGELVLEALDHAEAKEAAGALADLHPEAYRPFNLLVADPTDCYWLRHGGDGEIRVHQVPPGLHMLTAGDLDDKTDPRCIHFLPAFRAAAEPEPAADGGDWRAWIDLLGQHAADDAPREARLAAMNINGVQLAGGDYGTVASSLVAIPAYPGFDALPVFLHAEGAPDRTPFRPVPMAHTDDATGGADA
jgi:uncharacterized protein with NRDE domain